MENTLRIMTAKKNTGTAHSRPFRKENGVFSMDAVTPFRSGEMKS